MSSEQIIGTAYLTTLQGICKIIELVASFIGVLLVGIHFYGDVINVFEAGAAISICSAAIFLILYASGAVEKITFSMNRIQFFFHVILSIYYIIAVGLVFHHGRYYDRVIAGGVFGLFAILAHLTDAFDNYKKQPVF